jgi:predicted nuclease with TOPRIM domain
MCCQVLDLSEPAPEQKAEQAEIQKELEKAQEHYRTLSEKLYGKDWVRTKEQIEQLEKEQQEVRKRMTELYSKLPAESERHGWVWLFLRKEIQRISAD